jgi:propanol-preferring alcohol dehydrogenase
VIRETRPLSTINESIDDVLKGKISGRIVFDMASSSTGIAAQSREEVGAAS